MAQYAAVMAATATFDLTLKLFTLSLSFRATLLSSISRRPVPSTSQTPACAMFHSPVSALPRNPTAKKSGSAMTARCDAP